VRRTWPSYRAADVPVRSSRAGTDLHLFESGFTGPDDHRLNDGGWDGDVIPALRRRLGEPKAG
jgi:hypothetical protein